MKLSVYLNTLRQKGFLAYEYNPFHNYQTEVDLYLVDKKFLVPKDQAVNTKNGELLTKVIDYSSDGVKCEYWIDKRGMKVTDNILTASSGTLYASAGSVIDFDTDQLNFDLDHPVDIQIQPSYDGSVNLILNDDKNIPRLINSRFSPREKNTYEIVDRIGENDTNIYNSKTFDKDTSLYFQYEYNPTIAYLGFIKGILPVGQYCFYFTYCDADENESDFIAESGLVPLFMGTDKDPFSIDGGIKNQSSNKGVRLKLSNLDKSYNYLKVYYVRYFADYQQNRVYECKKIYQKYPINSGYMYLQITGNEQAEDIDANILNISRFNPKSVLTSAQCKNMLFFGNIVKNTDNYKELSDCALRIIPEITRSKISDIDYNYRSDNSVFGYYNSQNMYNNVGYFNEEYYRFGVVFIYKNGTLSNVYNTLGGDLCLNQSEKLIQEKNVIYSNDNPAILVREYIEIDDKGWVNSTERNSFSGHNINAKGVCQFKLEPNEISNDTIIGVTFNIPDNIVKHLDTLGIRGLFFVRQKCVPNILAQCYLTAIDEQLEAPVIESTEGYFTECFVTQNSDKREVSNDYDKRLYFYKNVKNTTKSISGNAYAAICPDFLLNQPYYNQIFNGSKFRLKKITESKPLKRNNRFYKSENSYETDQNVYNVSIATVTENVSTIALNDKIYRLEIGSAEESFRFKYAEVDNGSSNMGSGNEDEVDKATNIVRGIYSPYLAIYSNNKLEINCLYNIYQEMSAGTTQEYQNRMDSSEPFYAISDRYNFKGLTNNSLTCWRGDCYLNTFTYRLNRNFNDPSLPNNDQIIDKDTWKDNYRSQNPDEWTNISRSDINAVQLGSWITIKLRSSMNYALRSQDHSYVSEEALMGSPRSFYPRSQVMWRGENKLPDSYLYNDAYRASLGFKCYFTLKDVNYIKDTFSNRIQYSAISIQDSFKNNYRESLSTYFRDYSQEYGSIQKLLGFVGYILVIFEHGIGIAVINERVMSGSGDGGPVFINTQNVLPEELTIVSDTYGTQWPESVVKSEVGYVYGVDTIAKKIWRVKDQQIEIISDFKVNKFLVDNITLGERELNPIIGLKNVKSHYNNNKKDIMFTFYDDVYQDEEKAWNLCYNEILQQFTTFYSWIPSYSENIDTKFFTFNRDTSKELTLLGKCNYSVYGNTGVLVDSPILKNDYQARLYYVSPDKSGEVTYTVQNSDGTTSLKTITIDLEEQDNKYVFQNVSYKLEKDHWGSYKYVDEVLLKEGILSIKEEAFQYHKVVLLYVTPYMETETIQQIVTGTVSSTNFRTEVIALTKEYTLTNQLLTEEQKKQYGLTTDFYLHGQAGIFNVAEDLYPTYWYGEYHPFEFEFVVNDKIGQQKIFTNLEIISNKAEPESFHFEIEGDNYEFSQDKRTMFFRQEATKELYQNLGSDILFNRKYTDIVANKLTQEQFYRGGTKYKYEGIPDKIYPQYEKGLVQQVKSTIFPLYYQKIDTYNDVYYKYNQMLGGDSYDFKNLSGSEIIWNRDLNQFDIVTHIKNSPIDLVGRLRGNSRYKEGKWNIQIPSITFMQKNESKWDKPPIVINSQYVPKDLKNTDISENNLPNIYIGRKNYPDEEVDLRKYVDVSSWTYRKETKIRDKWIKIRVRYSGKNLAVIHSLVTLYNISYS